MIVTELAEPNKDFIIRILYRQNTAKRLKSINGYKTELGKKHYNNFQKETQVLASDVNRRSGFFSNLTEYSTKKLKKNPPNVFIINL